VLGNPLPLVDIDGEFAYCGFWCQVGQFFSGGNQSGGGDNGGEDDEGPPPGSIFSYTGGWQTGGGGGGGGQQNTFQKPKPSPAQPSKKVVRTGNYPTLDCDGYSAAGSILPQTTKQGMEFGGFLYQNSNGRYSYSNPVAGAPTSIPDLFKSPQAFVSGIVGWFHTHPLVPGFNNDRFSGSDL
jgi:hypothetical protein